MCMLPATISNNVPGTDLSIGADTALNAIVEVRPVHPSQHVVQMMTRGCKWHDSFFFFFQRWFNPSCLQSDMVSFKAGCPEIVNRFQRLGLKEDRGYCFGIDFLRIWHTMTVVVFLDSKYCLRQRVVWSCTWKESGRIWHLACWHEVLGEHQQMNICRLNLQTVYLHNSVWNIPSILFHACLSLVWFMHAEQSLYDSWPQNIFCILELV